MNVVKERKGRILFYYGNYGGRHCCVWTDLDWWSQELSLAAPTFNVFMKSRVRCKRLNLVCKVGSYLFLLVPSRELSQSNLFPESH